MMQQARLFLIEDEEDICTLLKMNLEQNGYVVEMAQRGKEGLEAILHLPPDLIMLDWMLPDISGIELCKKLKQDSRTSSIPLILVTAKSTEEDIVYAFEAGVSDYITKPFSLKILLSRIKACLHKNTQGSQSSSSLIRFGLFTFDTQRHLLTKGDKEIVLTLCEFNILKRLLLNRGNILSRDQLLNDLSDEADSIIDRNIDVHMCSIRKKLGPRFHWIETIRSLGYRFRL